MGVKDGAGRFEERARAETLRVLKRSAAEVDAALAKGGLTSFGQAEALARRQAIQRAIAKLEKALPETIARVAGETAQAASVTEVRIHGEPLAVRAEVSEKAVRLAAESAAEAVVGVTDALRRDLNKAVLGATSGAYTRERFDTEIRNAFAGDVLEHRVERIARTEISRVYMGQQAETDKALADMPGVDLIKRWVKSGKSPGRSRPEHDAIHGQERELDEPFDIGGGATAATPPGGGALQAQTPNDPALPADQSVNCGCDYVRVPRSEATQPYISKVPTKAPEPVEAAGTAS